MTRKHFIAIANIVRDLIIDAPAAGFDEGHTAGVEELARNMADYFVTENPNFDRARFLKACGL